MPDQDLSETRPFSIEDWRDLEDRHRRTERALLERIKELDCLYAITRLGQDAHRPLDEILTAIAALVPGSWQYPDLACAAIRVEDTHHCSAAFRRTPWRQSSPIAVCGEICGEIEVCYLRECPPGDEGPFLGEERSLIDAVADLIGRIVGQRRAEEETHLLSRELIRAQETERQRIARELHDHLAQDLSLARADLDRITAGLSAPLLPQVVSVAERLSTAIASIRDLSYGLLPPGLCALGLLETVMTHCEDFSERYGIEIEVYADGLDGIEFDFETQINLYRLIQEALHNVRRHARASRVVIRFLGSHPNLLLRIEDDGCGMDVEACQARAVRNKRMGLRNMRERVRLLGGRFTLRSRPGQGMRILVETPISRSDRDRA